MPMNITEDYIPSKEFAKKIGVQNQTVIRSLCVNGHYMGLKPLKLPNGRNVFRKSDVALLFKKIADANQPLVCDHQGGAAPEKPASHCPGGPTT
jgi:hypothetical protein